jgi:cytidylate kinase
VDGRDIGTVVFPDADVKVFLTATPEARARRRLLQRGDVVAPEALAREAGQLARRDAADASREVAPLRRPPDAVELDTSDMTFAGQVDRIVALAREALAD